jgi:hypothetical protein
MNNKTVWAAIWISPRQKIVRLEADLIRNLKEEADLKLQIAECRKRLAVVRVFREDITETIAKVTCEKHERSKRKREQGSEESSSDQEDTRRFESDSSVTSEDYSESPEAQLPEVDFPL